MKCRDGQHDNHDSKLEIRSPKEKGFKLDIFSSDLDIFT